MFITGCVSLTIQSVFLLVIMVRITATNDNENKKSDDPKIFGGTEVDIEEIPYQVSIRLLKEEKYKKGTGHICGGSLITQRVVLTAAHCCFSKKTKVKRQIKDLQLVMGNTYRNRYSSTEQTYRVADMRIHDLYDPDTHQNDIALLLTDRIVPMESSLVEPIGLASSQYEYGTIGQVSGWGKTNPHIAFHSGSMELRKATLKIVENEMCQGYLKDVELTSSQICALGGGTGTCPGDSGGPFVCEDELVGVVSLGDNWCMLFDVFTNVFYYKDWIENQSKKLRAGSKSVVPLSCYWHCLTVLVIFFTTLLSDRIYMICFD